MGKRAEGKACPIIARFEHFKQREMVKSHSKELKGTKYWLNDQFPTEINNRRKKCTPIPKEYRNKNQKVALVVDKLYINNQLFRDSNVTPWLC